MRAVIYSFTAALVFSGIMLSGCGPEGEPLDSDLQKKKVQGMIIRENTVMRIDPIMYAARVTLLNRAEIIDVLDKSREIATVGDSRGYWYKVRTENGISGWVWGKNIQFFTDKSKESIDSFVSSFWEEETERVMKQIAGMWWSVDLRGDFTKHALEIHPDGKYKSYLRGGSPIIGEYNLNFKDNEIIFLKGTTFKSNLHIIRRGTMVYLEKEVENDIVKFQKTSSRLDKDDKEEGDAPTEERGDAN